MKILNIDKCLSGYNRFHEYIQTSSYIPTPPLGQDMTQGQFLSGV